MDITPEQARAELAKRELARREKMKSSGNDENLFQKVIRHGIKDPAIGLLEMGREFANIPNKLSGGYIPELSPSEFNFGESLGVEKPTGVDRLIQGIAQYGPSLALPGANIGKAGKVLESIPKIGKFLSKGVSEAIPQGLYSAAQAPQDNMVKSGVETTASMTPLAMISELMKSTNPIARNIAKGLGGAAGALSGREVGKEAGFGEVGSDVAALLGGALGARGFNTKKEIKRNLTEGVNPELAGKRLEAANRLGLDYLTPAEAGISPWAAKKQGSLGRTEEGSKLLYEKGMQRQGSERKSIESTLDKIYSDKMDPMIKESYDKISSVRLPNEFSEKYLDNEIVKRAKKMVDNNPSYKEELKNIPKDSLVYWDHIKRSLDDMVNVSERKGNKNEARIISNTRAEMRDQMDSNYPEYAQARSLYELKKTREGLEKVFDQKEVNGTNFYKALASDKKFDELMGHLRNAPEAQKNLKDMKLLFKDLMGPPTIKTAKGKEEYGMNMARNEGDFLKNLFEHAFTKGGNDKAAIEFITSKDWNKQLKEINKISDKKLKMAALSMMISKGVSQYAGMSD